uniref:sigma 54-interacting transcriptional regulator n=1 Tax=Salidesulfovibrio brasiliensis TaxID=221711 RepID=UPI000A42A0BC|nr:sigma 54-interacting transcriptional regulator [Salidesulfovibrio brasiliensis]
MQGKILVVEPDAQIRESLCDALSAAGNETMGVVDVESAKRVFSPFSPHMVLAGSDGDPRAIGVMLREFKCGGLERPFAVMAAEECMDDALAEACPGAFAFLRKPLVMHRVMEVVSLALRSRENVVNGLQVLDESRRVNSYLRSILESYDEPAALLDAEGRILEVNEAGVQVIGADYESIRNSRFVDIVRDPFRSLCEQAMESIVSGSDSERILHRRGGSEVETYVTPVRQDGRLVGMVALARNVTSLHRTQQELIENEQRYRSVFEAGRDAVLIVNRASGDVLDCNRAARRLFGYTAEEMETLNYIRDLAAEPDRGTEVLAAEAGRMPVRKHRRKDGDVFPAEATLSPFAVSGEQMATVFVRDITSRKVVEDALREGARLYRAVVEDQTELICRYRPDGVLTFVNRAYARFFGYSEDSLVGVNFMSRIADEWARRTLAEWIENVSPAKPSIELEQRNEGADGKTHWVHWMNRAIFDHRGELREFQAVGRDITESRLAAKALREANEEKERFRLNLEAAFRSIPDAIITVDANMRVIATNSAAQQICELAPGDSRGRALEELMSSEPNPCLSVLKQVLRTRRTVRGFQAELTLSTGERMVELSCSPLLDEQHNFSGAVLVVKDISRIADLEKRLQERHGFRGIVGKSRVMQDVYRLLEQLAPLDATVLICGESGTGKELAADALHYGGARASAHMVKVNCSALSESLLESELFGHVKGAFTGAVRDKVGRIEAAEGGTLFLDEIADISPIIQLKLLRFLEQKEYERVGESSTRKADVRIIAATNVDLRRKVDEGTFREDLFYRLNVMPVYLPPLREREGDIPLLTAHFLKEFSQEFKKKLDGVAEEVMDLFLRYDWPGNIRELKHLLEHACILCPERIIAVRHVRPDALEVMRGGVPKSRMSVFRRRSADSEEIIAALEAADGNKSRAADILGVHRATLYRKMKRLGLAE